MSDPLDMTLREYLALAVRVGDASKTIRDALALTAPAATPPPAEATAPRGSEVTLTNKGVIAFSPAEQARREQLRLERAADVGDERIAAMEAGG